MYADTGYHPGRVKPGEFNSIMPWLMYSKMNKEDLAAIYAYPRQVKSIKNSVVKFTPAGKSPLKKTRRHAEFISASHVQVSTGKVCNRQVGGLAGVNILWDAEINSA